MRSRRGVSVLLVVMLVAFVIGLVALAVHSLWRGSSRNLFSVNEHRELVNLGHACVAETLWAVETRLEQGDGEVTDWFTSDLETVPPIDETAALTEDYCKGIGGEGANLVYTPGKVSLERIQGLPLTNGMRGRLGVVDFVVTVRAERRSPRHTATLKMARRHAFWLSDGLTPFTKGGRHVEILATPVATFLEYP